MPVFFCGYHKHPSCDSCNCCCNPPPPCFDTVLGCSACCKRCILILDILKIIVFLIYCKRNLCILNWCIRCHRSCRSYWRCRSYRCSCCKRCSSRCDSCCRCRCIIYCRCRSWSRCRYYICS